MATLERPPPLATPLEYSPLDDISELTESVPTPFPARGRTGPTNAITADERTTSRSPSVGRKLGFGGVMDKVKRAMSRDRMAEGTPERRSSIDSTIPEEPRGRINPLNRTMTNATTTTTGRASSRSHMTHSTGRGGAGNIRSPSRGRALLPMAAGEEDLEEGEETPEAIAAAREVSDSRSRSRGRVELLGSGRGGRGNIVSPNRDPASIERAAKELEFEKEVERKRKEAGPTAKGVSSGRGGSGNIRIVKAPGGAGLNGNPA